MISSRRVLLPIAPRLASFSAWESRGWSAQPPRRVVVAGPVGHPPSFSPHGVVLGGNQLGDRSLFGARLGRIARSRPYQGQGPGRRTGSGKENGAGGAANRRLDQGDLDRRFGSTGGAANHHRSESFLEPFPEVISPSAPRPLEVPVGFGTTGLGYSLLNLQFMSFRAKERGTIAADCGQIVASWLPLCPTTPRHNLIRWRNDGHPASWSTQNRA